MKRTRLLLLFALFPFIIFAQKYTISGYISDEENGEKLIAANVLDQKSLAGTVTNTYGFFSLTLPKDSITLSISYIGYQPKELKLYLDKDISLEIDLSSSVSLEVVEIVGEKLEKIQESSQMSRIEVPVEQIKKVPALLGEVDVFKTLQLLPGVQSGGEGQSGLYVRGGSPDQNLVLLDGVPVYNVSHLLGFFSVFNADAIKNVTLTKGGVPARFGGRLSSVLEINMKEGNNEEFHGEGSIGFISSKLTLEGPIKKDVSSYIISARRTYVDIFARPIARNQAKKNGDELTPTLFFYDLNAKFNYKINKKHRLYFSTYTGKDVFGIESRDNLSEGNYTVLNGGTDWGNITAAFRWNYMITNKLFANTTITHSRFKFDFNTAYEDVFNEEQDKFSARYFSGIYDWAGKVDFDFIPNPNHYIKFGVSATNHTYEPGAFQFQFEIANESPIDTTLGSQNAKSWEYSAYMEDNLQFGRFKANIGLHAAAFDVDNTTYYSIQPRFGVRYLLNNNIALKASYTKMAQFINLLTNESLSLPTDLWVPSTARIKPQDAWQVAAGVATTLWKEYEFSVEGYYKKMDNVLSYKEGADFIGPDSDWQDKVTQGEGESYGVEVFLQKKKGKTTGWLGYTLSWNWRQFDEINSGNRFPFKYDRRHDLSLVLSHQFNKRVSVTGAWIYGTGNAITLPLYRYTSPVRFDGGSYSFNEIENIGDKNSFRMRAYHRMDVNVEIQSRKNERRRWQGAWNIGVYNGYNRNNPYFITTGRNDEGQRTFRQISIFPMIPSVSYKFQF
ncbi:MAG: TonB-dependent receptor [Bacteroidota bacterium]